MIWNLEKTGCALKFCAPLNPLNYLNRLEGRFINLEYNWNGQFFVQMKIGEFVDVNQNNMEITFKIMKKNLEIYWKTWKIMESHAILSVWKSGNPENIKEKFRFRNRSDLGVNGA